MCTPAALLPFYYWNVSAKAGTLAAIWDHQVPLEWKSQARKVEQQEEAWGNDHITEPHNILGLPASSFSKLTGKSCLGLHYCQFWVAHN